MDHDPNKESHKSCGGCTGIFWWATLAVAVLAIPAFGIVVSVIFPFRGLGALVIFVLACWLCTYLGMRLMANPIMHEKIGSHKEKH